MGRIAETLKRVKAILESVGAQPKPVSKIAEELNLRWNTVQLYINELSTLGLVRAERQRTAPPVTLVSLTDKGRALLKCIRETEGM